jgi:NtrC-family two-component system sensor histidine kinase KinB
MPGPDAQVIAVAELSGGDMSRFRDPEQMQLLETFARQAAAALDRVRLAADSRRARQLVELNRLKSQFIAVAAHELRTPLTSLGLATELLAEQLVGPEREHPRIRELLDTALDDVQRLRTLVEDLLDLSRLEERSVRLEVQRLDPREVLRRAVEATKLQRIEAGARVEIEVGSVPDVAADAARIDRALGNLIQNAIRHAGRDGRVVVSADELPDFVQISVADDGPGLAIGDQDRVFEPFVSGDAQGRSGLGLAIAREIVRAHGGDIWVDSGPGPGAVFSFTVPIAEPRAANHVITPADDASAAVGPDPRETPDDGSSDTRRR